MQTKEGRLSEYENAMWCWRGGEIAQMPEIAAIGSFETEDSLDQSPIYAVVQRCLVPMPLRMVFT